MSVGRWRSGWLCALGMLFLCVFVAEGGGKKKKSLLVLPVDYVEGVTGSAKASEPFTDDLRDVVEKQGAYRLLSPTLGFQRLAGVSGNPSSLGRLLGGGEKPDKVMYVKVTKVGKRYILRGALYRQIGGEWSVERKKKLVRKGKESDVSVWLGEMYDSLLPSAASPLSNRLKSKRFLARGVEFLILWIPRGTFVMGSPNNETGRLANEGPQRRVEISKGFWMLETEVTQGQYKALMGSNPSYFQECGDECPVENVTWHDARAFANKLSDAEKLAPCTKTGREVFQCKGWRLPTEAEWEYAARAGTTTAFHTGDCISTAQANYHGDHPSKNCAKGEYRGKTTVVCSLARNAWGLCDMHGNVWEWVMDVSGPYEGMFPQDPLRNSDGESRVIRGGCWSNGAGGVRSAVRFSVPSMRGNSATGFRLVRY